VSLSACSRCSSCCRVTSLDNRIDVIIFPDDLERLSSYLQVKPKEFVQAYCREEFFSNCDRLILYYVLKTESGHCIFLKNKDCIVHSCKPIQCEMAPGNFFNFPGLWEYMPCVKENGIRYREDPTKHEMELVKSLLDDEYNPLL